VAELAVVVMVCAALPASFRAGPDRVRGRVRMGVRVLFLALVVRVLVVTVLVPVGVAVGGVPVDYAVVDHPETHADDEEPRSDLEHLVDSLGHEVGGGDGCQQTE